MTDQTAHQPLTDQQLDEIEARVTAATPGPWEPYHSEYGPTFYANTTGEHLRGVGDFNFGAGDEAEADEAFVRHAQQDVTALLAEIRRLKAVCGDLADRWDKEATGTQKAIDTDPLGGEVESAQHERVHVYRTTARDLRALLATGRIPEDLLTTTERVPAAAVAGSEACGKCKQPFDPADISSDGRGRFHLTPYCRRCVNFCRDSEIADHRCVICA